MKVKTNLKAGTGCNECNDPCHGDGDVNQSNTSGSSVVNVQANFNESPIGVSL
jgi:hypothetical protein